ncbi:YopX family protein [Clostridium perfringens]
MNRDIKFRAWDEELEEMLYTESEEWFDDGVYFRFNKHEDELRHDLMRYTGLKDKNGKDIYEGDIVSFYNDEEYKFKSTNALVIYDSAAFMLEHKKLGKEYLGEMDIENMCIKIIGNIYENPELLEGDEQ